MTATLYQLPTARRQPDPIWIVRWQATDGQVHTNRVQAPEPGEAERLIAVRNESFYEFVGRAVMELQPRVPKDAWDLALGLLDEEARRLQAKADKHALIGRGDYWRDQARVHREAFARLLRAGVEAE